jgi:hypothetical protein
MFDELIMESLFRVTARQKSGKTALQYLVESYQRGRMLKDEACYSQPSCQKFIEYSFKVSSRG